MPKLPAAKNQPAEKGADKSAPLPEITDVRITVLTDKGNLLAMASVTIGAAFVVSGLRVVNGSKGVFVSMPSRKDEKGEYHDTAFPLSKAGRDHVSAKVIAAFEAA